MTSQYVADQHLSKHLPLSVETYCIVLIHNEGDYLEAEHCRSARIFNCTGQWPNDYSSNIVAFWEFAGIKKKD